MKSNSVLQRSLWLWPAMLLGVLITSCHPQEPEPGELGVLVVSDVHYTTVVSGVWVLDNNNLSLLGGAIEDKWVDADGDTVLRVLTITDYLLDNGNTYETGVFQLMKKVNPPGYEDYDGDLFNYKDTEYRPYVKVNGRGQYYDKIGPLARWPRFIMTSEGVSVLYCEKYPNGEVDHNNNPMFGQNYMVMPIGGTPKIVANQEDTETNRASTVNSIKEYDGKYYLVGTRDRGGAIFCDASNLSMPYILSMYVSAAYDFIKTDTDTFWVCGTNETRATLWRFNGNSFDEVALEGADGTVASEARVIKQVGEDIYVGGRLGDFPAIWKNQKLLGQYTNFTYKQMQSSAVVALEVFGNKAYTVITSDGSVDVKDVMYAEWDFSGDTVRCESKYELFDLWLSMMIEVPSGFWDNIYYSSPRVSLSFVRVKPEEGDTIQ